MLSNKLDEIKKDLQELIEIIDGLKSYDEIPSIDIDLMKHKMLDSYNNIISLNKLEASVETIENIAEENRSEPEIELELIEKVEDAPVEAKEFYQTVVEENSKEEEENNKDLEEVVEEIEEAIKVDAIEEEAPISTEIIKETKEEAPTKKLITIDKSSNTDLANIFQSIQNESDNAAITQFTAISDIKAAISINERIGFISDIFAGDNNKFNECLNKINNIEDINMAILELNNVTEWDIENHNHKSFLEVVYRKFI